jgi:hypothetical protein
MNFLVEAQNKISPNSEMDKEKIVIAEEFPNKFVSFLGILVQVGADKIVANGTIFLSPQGWSTWPMAYSF